jgi:hypothetical protein
MQTATSFRQIRKLKLDDNIQITKAGGFVKARYAGASNFVFGEDKEQALQRVRKSPKLSMRDNPANLKRRESNWACGYREGKP